MRLIKYLMLRAKWCGIAVILSLAMSISASADGTGGAAGQTTSVSTEEVLVEETSPVKLAVGIPAAPSLRKLTVASGTSLRLTWGKVSGASGYTIYRKNSSGKWEWIKTIASGNTTSYTDTGLQYGKKYIYTVKAYHVSGDKRVYSSYDKSGLTAVLPKKPDVKTSLTAYKSKTVVLSVTNRASMDTVSYKSSNTSIATVGSSSGKVIGEKTGTCTITTAVKRGSSKYTFKTKVTVKNVRLGNSANNKLASAAMVTGGFAVTSGDYTYFTAAERGIYRVKTSDGSGSKCIYDIYKKKGDRVESISAYGDYLYFIYTYNSEKGSYLLRIKKDGSSKKTICKTGEYCIANDYLYYTYGRAIYRQKIGSTSTEKIMTIPDQNYVNSMFCDGVRLYLNMSTDSPEHSYFVYCMNPSGSGGKKIIASKNYALMFGMTGNKIFYFTRNISKETLALQTCSYDGSGKKTIVVLNNDQYNGFATDGDYIYFYPTSENANIERIAVDGTGRKTILKNNHYCYNFTGINIAGNHLMFSDNYWVNGQCYIDIKMLSMSGKLIKQVLKTEIARGWDYY